MDDIERVQASNLLPHPLNGNEGNQEADIKRQQPDNMENGKDDDGTDQSTSTSAKDAVNIADGFVAESFDPVGGVIPPENIDQEAAGDTVPSAIAPTDDATAAAPVGSNDGPPYCAFGEWEKRSYIIMASFSAMISPFASSVYYPAVDELAADLGVSVSLITLTISMYLIFQGIAPSVTAAVSETYGRRPPYLACFVIFLAANIGLALQDSYAALMVLRCVQSSGSSGTIALGSGVMADLTTRSERGKYSVYLSLGPTLGPSLGPVIGGLLSNYLGWRAIFWFLVILCGVVGTVMVIGLSETNRSIVGNGSIPPPRWNRSLVQAAKRRDTLKPPTDEDLSTLDKNKKRVNPLTSVYVLREKENFFLIMYAGIQWAGYISITSILSSQLTRRYHLSTVDVGLCYLPIGLGTLSSRWTMAVLIDKNFRREARKQGLTIVKNRQQDISQFNVEVARLNIALPLIVVSACFVLAYGWAMEEVAPLPVILVILFFTGMLITGTFVCISALAIDINRDRPASTAAAGNLVRCLLGAGAVAIATPLIDAIGIGWTSTMTAGIWMLFLPLLFVVRRNGHRWRMEKAAKQKESEDVARA